MDELNVHISNQINQESSKLQKAAEKIKNLFSGPKIIFAILGVVILIEIVYAIRVLTAPTISPLSPRKPSVQASTVGKISLTTSKTNYQIGETVPVAVVVTTGSHTIDGADLIVHFDPKILEVTRTGLVQGKVFSEYPLMSLDVKKGLVTISGINSAKGGFKGTGIFAVMNFKAKGKGETLLTVDFKKDSTTDSNLVEMSTSKDILEKVDDLKVTVQ